MPKQSDRDRGPKQPKVIRRNKGERRSLPGDLEAFAAGDDDALWRRPTKPRIRDPRPVLLIEGVANRDARAVYEARHRRLIRLRDAGDRVALGRELVEATRARIWRAHSIVGFEAFVVDVLDIPRDEADGLIADHGGAPPLDDETIAIWVRTEAGLVEVCGPDSVVRLTGDPGEERLCLEVPHAAAPAAFSAIGRRATPLARERAEAPDSVLDRPKGVQALSKILERDADDDW